MTSKCCKSSTILVIGLDGDTYFCKKCGKELPKPKYELPEWVEWKNHYSKLFNAIR